MHTQTNLKSNFGTLVAQTIPRYQYSIFLVISKGIERGLDFKQTVMESTSLKICSLRRVSLDRHLINLQNIPKGHDLASLIRPVKLSMQGV